MTVHSVSTHIHNDEISVKYVSNSDTLLLILLLDEFPGSCPHGNAWVDIAKNVDEAHSPAECSNRGICDRKTGTCDCFEGYSGIACNRSKCSIDRIFINHSESPLGGLEYNSDVSKRMQRSWRLSKHAISRPECYFGTAKIFL